MPRDKHHLASKTLEDIGFANTKTNRQLLRNLNDFEDAVRDEETAGGNYPECYEAIMEDYAHERKLMLCRLILNLNV